MKKRDTIFLLSLLVAVLAVWGGMQILRKSSPSQSGIKEGRLEEKPQGPSIRITVNGEDYGFYSLLQDQEIDIKGKNVCSIQDGQALMTEANCPDHLCMQMPAIDAPYELIVCLPNGIVIEGVPEEEETMPIDGVS